MSKPERAVIRKKVKRPRRRFLKNRELRHEAIRSIKQIIRLQRRDANKPPFAAATLQRKAEALFRKFK